MTCDQKSAPVVILLGAAPMLPPKARRLKEDREAPVLVSQGDAVRMHKVLMLRKLISEGSYRVSSDMLAESLMQRAHRSGVLAEGETKLG